MGFDIDKDIKRRAAAFELEKRINWDEPIMVHESATFQIFKSDYTNMHIAVKLHKHMICMTIIYGMENERLIDTTSGNSSYAFSGFMQQNGRMPTDKDEIVIIAGKYYFSNTRKNVIHSNINWKLK